jgi:carbon monoxide dehydrogenase subunit G
VSWFSFTRRIRVRAFDVEANVGGKLAQLGGRLVDGVSKKMADQFSELARFV